MAKNIEMNYKSESGYEILYPSTITSNVTNLDGMNLTDILDNQRMFKVGDLLYTNRNPDSFSTEWMECNGQEAPAGSLINGEINNDNIFLQQLNNGLKRTVYSNNKFDSISKIFYVNEKFYFVASTVNSSLGAYGFYSDDGETWQNFQIMSGDGVYVNLEYFDNKWFLSFRSAHYFYYAWTEDFMKFEDFTNTMAIDFNGTRNEISSSFFSNLGDELYITTRGYNNSHFRIYKWSGSEFVRSTIGANYNSCSEIVKNNGEYVFFAARTNQIMKITMADYNSEYTSTVIYEDISADTLYLSSNSIAKINNRYYIGYETGFLELGENLELLGNYDNSMEYLYNVGNNYYITTQNRFYFGTNLDNMRLISYTYENSCNIREGGYFSKEGNSFFLIPVNNYSDECLQVFKINSTYYSPSLSTDNYTVMVKIN